MARNLIINGRTYSIPTDGDFNWGDNVEAYLVAISEQALWRTGGSFSLTAPLNLGTSFGLEAVSYSGIDSNISARSGLIRLAHNEVISWRNQANDADISLGVNNSGHLIVNGVNINETFANRTLDQTPTDGNTDNVVSSDGLFTALNSKEPSLGNPTNDFSLLVGWPDGRRSWIQTIGGNSISDNGIDTIHLRDNAVSLAKLSQAVRDLINGKEDNLGNPTGDNYFLTSLADGTRSWLQQIEGGSQIEDNSITENKLDPIFRTKVNNKENSLGNPSRSGQVLSSDTNGIRSWIDSAASITASVVEAIAEKVRIGDTVEFEEDGTDFTAHVVKKKANLTGISFNDGSNELDITGSGLREFIAGSVDNANAADYNTDKAFIVLREGENYIVARVTGFTTGGDLEAVAITRYPENFTLLNIGTDLTIGLLDNVKAQTDARLLGGVVTLDSPNYRYRLNLTSFIDVPASSDPIHTAQITGPINTLAINMEYSEVERIVGDEIWENEWQPVLTRGGRTLSRDIANLVDKYFNIELIDRLDPSLVTPERVSDLFTLSTAQVFTRVALILRRGGRTLSRDIANLVDKYFNIELIDRLDPSLVTPERVSDLFTLSTAQVFTRVALILRSNLIGNETDLRFVIKEGRKTLKAVDSIQQKVNENTTIINNLDVRDTTNLLYNSNFTIDQENARNNVTHSTFDSNVSSKYACDGWRILGRGASSLVTKLVLPKDIVTQNPTLLRSAIEEIKELGGFLKMNFDSRGETNGQGGAIPTEVGILQRVESQVSAQFLGRNTAYCRTWIYSNNAINVTATVAPASSEDDFSSLGTTLSSSPTPVPANTWTLVETEIDISSLATQFSALNGLQFGFNAEVPVANGREIYFAQSQVTTKQQEYSPRGRTPEEELLLCYRFFNTTYESGINITTNAGRANKKNGAVFAPRLVTDSWGYNYHYPVEMVREPTISFYSTYSGRINQFGQANSTSNFNGNYTREIYKGKNYVSGEVKKGSGVTGTPDAIVFNLVLDGRL